MQAVAADIGGTHARFAIATPGAGGSIALSHEAKLKVADFASLETAFHAYRRQLGAAMPRRAAIAVAAPVEGELLKLTNNPWAISPARAAGQLGLDEVIFINDFAAVAYAVSACPAGQFEPIAGPRAPLPANGAVTVVGPGTGLGVALLVTGAHARVVPTEGGHLDYAPLDSLEDRILAHLRERYRRVSVERVVSGPGLGNIHGALAAIEGRAIAPHDDAALWAAALSGEDALARTAFDRWCMALGSVSGDLALAHGAQAVVLAGGMLPRVRHLLCQSAFHARFVAKGRFEHRMSALPILHITHPEPGLLGAAAALFSKERP